MRAVRDAGPPLRWLLVAGVLWLPVVLALFLAGVRDGRVLVAVPLVLFVAVCAADRRGWRIRMATAELAARQRERWTWGRLPVDPVAADAWLRAHEDAPPEVRATVMATTGRHEEARNLLAGATPETPLDAVRIARLRILFAAEAADDHSITGALAELEGRPELRDVPVDEQRFQRLSLAWSIAWLRIHAGEPWRDDFADAVGPLAPFRVPLRYLIFHAIQQDALPIAYVLAFVIVTVLGLTDVLLNG
jgi:hypothetical protein